MAATTLTVLLLAVLLHTAAAAAGVLERTERSAEAQNTTTTDCETRMVQNFYVNSGENTGEGTQGPAGPQGERGPQGLTGLAGGGATYIRWGRDDCPSTAQLLYNGMAGGSFYNQHGGGNSYLCLPYNPQYLSYRNGVNPGRAYVYGAEYQVEEISAFPGMNQHNVPCAVCHTPTRGAKIMIPARTSCPSSWTREYYGYLMAGGHNHPRSAPFECVDVSAESLPSTAADTNGALFYFTESRCVGICPPYVDGKELTCAVCTK